MNWARSAGFGGAPRQRQHAGLRPAVDGRSGRHGQNRMVLAGRGDSRDGHPLVRGHPGAAWREYLHLQRGRQGVVPRSIAGEKNRLAEWSRGTALPVGPRRAAPGCSGPGVQVGGPNPAPSIRPPLKADSCSSATASPHSRVYCFGGPGPARKVRRAAHTALRKMCPSLHGSSNPAGGVASPIKRPASMRPAGPGHEPRPHPGDSFTTNG